MERTLIISMCLGVLIGIVAGVFSIGIIPLIIILFLTSTAFVLSEYLRGE